MNFDLIWVIVRVAHKGVLAPSCGAMLSAPMVSELEQCWTTIGAHFNLPKSSYFDFGRFTVAQNS